MKNDALTSDKLKLVLIQKGKRVKAFSENLRKNNIPLNNENNGLPEITNEYNKVLEELIIRSKTENYFWEFCSFDTYFRTYKSRLSQYIKNNKEVDERFFLNNEKLHFEKLKALQLIIHNDDPQILKHDPQSIYYAYYCKIEESQLRWFRNQRKIIDEFINKRIKESEEQYNKEVNKLISLDPLSCPEISGYETNFSEKVINKLYDGFRDKFIDCSRRDFVAFLSGGYLQTKITWLIKKPNNEIYKTSIWDFITVLGLPIVKKKLDNIFIDDKNNNITMSNYKKDSFSKYRIDIEKILAKSQLPNN